MFPNLKYDFRRVYQKTSYKGKLRKVFIALGAQGFQAIAGYRVCRWLAAKHIPLLGLFVQRCVEIFTGISIPDEAEIGKGLMINHFGGIVINGGTKVGDFCTISHNVTLGNKKPGGGSPKIGNHVFIAVGAKVLGDITVGDHSIIGANAVLTQSVPANSIVAGIPAKVVRTFKDGSEYREFFYEA